MLLALLAFGNKHFSPDDRSVRIVNVKTGEDVIPVLADPATGHPVDGPDYRVVSSRWHEVAV